MAWHNKEGSTEDTMALKVHLSMVLEVRLFSLIQHCFNIRNHSAIAHCGVIVPAEATTEQLAPTLSVYEKLEPSINVATHAHVCFIVPESAWSQHDVQKSLCKHCQDNQQHWQHNLSHTYKLQPLLLASLDILQRLLVLSCCLIRQRLIHSQYYYEQQTPGDDEAEFQGKMQEQQCQPET